jgi:putative spermidine/putrescine transport system ATP-binding protein
VAGNRTAVRLRDVRRHFGGVQAVDGVSLEIEDGEFFSMLGPSGSGKTTCLRLVAGFDQPTSGSVELFDRPTAGVPPWERDVNTVFQDYALFPHMSVADNVAYGLRVRGVGRSEREARVREALALVRLPEVLERRPAQLSGGQRQRVALARALVNRPRVLLLDEPLGALDLKLRQEMQEELKMLQERLGISFLHVTHDQEEALAMSDRLAVLSQGRIEQVGTPAEVYERPATPFVAGFVGASNTVAGELARAVAGSPEPFSVRPEKIRLLRLTESVPADSCATEGRIVEAAYLGAFTRFVVEVQGMRLVVLEQNRDEALGRPEGRGGVPVRLAWPRAANRPLARV